MLAHLLTSAVRSLAVTVVVGSILIYATGGFDSPNAHGMVGVTAVCFFLFWITFFFTAKMGWAKAKLAAAVAAMTRWDHW